MNTRRYVRTMDLRSDPDLIAEYRRRHARGNVWPEVVAGIREVGITAMDIFILGTRLVMILETPADLDLDEAFAHLATLPKQQEWEDFMSVFQQAEPGASSADKWKDMEQNIELNT